MKCIFLPMIRAAPRQIRRRGQGCEPRPPPRIPSASARWVERRVQEVGIQSLARCKHNRKKTSERRQFAKRGLFSLLASYSSLRVRVFPTAADCLRHPLFVSEDPRAARSLNQFECAFIFLYLIWLLFYVMAADFAANWFEQVQIIHTLDKKHNWMFNFFGIRIDEIIIFDWESNYIDEK